MWIEEHKMKIFGVLFSFLWALCALGSVKQLGEYAENTLWPFCEESIEFYEINQRTPLGFSGAKLFDLTRNINSVKINYGYKPDQTVGSFNFSKLTSVARYVHSKAVYPAQSFELDISCADRVELDVNLTFISQDGSFMDSWDTTLRSEVPKAGEYAKFSVFLGRTDFRGSFYQDSSEEWLGGVLFGHLSTNELSAQISHTNYKCDNASCVTSSVIDAEIDSFIPYENL